MNKRRFLGLLVRGAAGLLVAPDALELIVEPRRRYWPGAHFDGPLQGGVFKPEMLSEAFDHIIKNVYIPGMIRDLQRHAGLMEYFNDFAQSRTNQLSAAQGNALVIPTWRHGDRGPERIRKIDTA